VSEVNVNVNVNVVFFNEKKKKKRYGCGSPLYWDRTHKQRKG